MNANSLRLALDGGVPVRTRRLPYGRQVVGDDDCAAVVDVLRSDWLTTGPEVAAFEAALAIRTSASETVAFCNGTAALHAAVHAIRAGAGDEVIVPAMTFVSTANAVVFEGATPIIVDVGADDLLIDPGCVEAAISPRTRAILAVDYAGQPCDYDRLRAIASDRGLALLSDACHSLGANDRGRAVGSLADLTAFSFHPVKTITTGEGGAVCALDPALASRMRAFRNHGLSRDQRSRELAGTWEYDMSSLGYNYRLTDFQCALGRVQLERLDAFVSRRREIATAYDQAFAMTRGVAPLATRSDVGHAFHLYVVLLDLDHLSANREMIYRAMVAEGIGVNVHYRPVNLHTYYRNRFGTRPGQCPCAERAYERMLTLPIHPGMTDGDVSDVIEAVRKVVGHFVVD